MLRRLGSNCRPLCNFLDCPKFPFCADRYFARVGLKRAGLPGRSEGSVVAKRSAPGFAFGSPPTHHTDAPGWLRPLQDPKSTRLNTSHLGIGYALYCLTKDAWL